MLDTIKKMYLVTHFTFAVMTQRAHHNPWSFIKRIRSNLFDTINAIHNHQYIEALDNKKISKEKLEIFVCEQYHIIARIKRQRLYRRNFSLFTKTQRQDKFSDAFAAL